MNEYMRLKLDKICKFPCSWLTTIILTTTIVYSCQGSGQPLATSLLNQLGQSTNTTRLGAGFPNQMSSDQNSTNRKVLRQGTSMAGTDVKSKITTEALLFLIFSRTWSITCTTQGGCSWISEMSQIYRNTIAPIRTVQIVSLHVRIPAWQANPKKK